MLNTLKLKGRIIELGLTQKDLASALNIAPATVSLKLNNIRGLSLDEAEILSKLLHINANDFNLYFFHNKLHNATSECQKERK